MSDQELPNSERPVNSEAQCDDSIEQIHALRKSRNRLGPICVIMGIKNILGINSVLKTF
jgi:DNA-binding FrmR family transcriptional regulator